MEKIVYRVEDANGNGPYSSNGYGGKVPTVSSSVMSLFSDIDGNLGFDDRCPGPWSDGIGEKLYSDHLFGFSSAFLATVWFREELPILEEFGFRIVPYRAKDVIISRSGKQLIFIPAK